MNGIDVVLRECNVKKSLGARDVAFCLANKKSRAVCLGREWKAI